MQVIKALRTHACLRRLVSVPTLYYLSYCLYVWVWVCAACVLFVLYYLFWNLIFTSSLSSSVTFPVILKAWWQMPLSSAHHLLIKLRKGIKTTEGGGTWAVLVWHGIGPSQCPTRSLSNLSKPWLLIFFHILLTAKWWCYWRGKWTKL